MFTGSRQRKATPAKTKEVPEVSAQIVRYFWHPSDIIHAGVNV